MATKPDGALSHGTLVSVIGSGIMGAGIAQVAALAGHPVALYDTRAEAVPKAIQGIRQNLEKLVSKQKLSSEAAERASSRLRAASSLNDLRESAMVIEAVVENLEVKRQLFAELENMVGAKCLLCTNTSSLSVTEIAATLRAPERLVGMHFFNPVPLMELVEVIRGVVTDLELLATVHAMASAWGKTPVYTKSSPGFIVNRVARPYYGEALLLLAEQAASPATIDAVMREAGGFRMGPFELMDLIGLDISFAVSQSIFNAYFGDPRYRPSLIQQEMVRAGFLGRKSKRGFYEYGENTPAPQPDTEPPAPRPERVTLFSQGTLAESLARRLAASGVAIARAPSPVDHGNTAEVGGAILAVTDGRSATQRAHETGHRNFVVVDLALDYLKATRLAITKASRCDERAYLSAVGLLQTAGFAVSCLRDVPGVAVMRSVAMLINEAADAVHQGVATVADVDTAMRKGVNYPRGPLAWADELGIETIQNVLTNLGAHYGGGRYRVSPRIRHLAWSGGTFHGAPAG
jgi:3-hydroxybutyryl-CoA dehydrogenase